MKRIAPIAATVVLTLTALFALAQPQPWPDGPASRPTEDAKRGLVHNEPGAFQGYTLFTPLRSTKTYLVDMQGRLVHEWTSEYRPGQSVYLLEDGRLLRTADDSQGSGFHGGGIGGRVQILGWDSTVLWDYSFASREHCQHHDVQPLPNGNILMIAWERKSKDEAVAAGCDPAKLGEELWPDFVVEVQPDGRTGGKIVWQWHVWDHLVQDVDKTKANYGVVADHPELIDANYDRNATHLAPAELERLRSLGYVGGEEPEGPEQPERDARNRRHADWLHTNAINYNAELDQIVLSELGFSELWVIDHSTTTKQAAGHSGGKYGKGGDLLYRWGNPQAYYAGRERDQRLFGQHDVQWITAGAGSGHFLVFNNGRDREDAGDDEEYSSVDEIVPPVISGGAYAHDAGKAFAPADPVWRYTGDPKSEFWSGHISGAQRLANGNTLICSGEQGRFFEVTPAGEIVWEYLNPFGAEGGPGGPRGGLFGMWGPPPGGPDGGPPPDERGRRRGPSDDRGDRRGPRGDGPPGFRPDGRPPRFGGRGPDDGRGPGGRRGPDGRRGPGGGPGHGPGEAYGAFRATRIAPDYPGLAGRDLRPKG